MRSTHSLKTKKSPPKIHQRKNKKKSPKFKNKHIIMETTDLNAHCFTDLPESNSSRVMISKSK